MKTLTITLLFICLTLIVFSQDTTNIKQNKLKPKATYIVGSAKVTIWENKNKDGTTWKSFKVEKVYKKKKQVGSSKCF